MGIEDWSKTAADNDDADAAINWVENQPPSTVNNSARAMMAATRTWYEDYEWRDWGHVVTYVTVTTFTIPGDVTTIYTTGRPIRCEDSSTLYGYIVSSSFSTDTTVTVELDSGALSGSLSSVAVGSAKCPHKDVPNEYTKTQNFNATTLTDAIVINTTDTDKYIESNQDATTALNNTVTRIGQSFTGDGNVLTGAIFHLSKTLLPTGNAVAKLYAHSGVYGTSSVATGSALATSENFDVSTLDGTLTLTYFQFNDEVTLTAATNYVIALEYTGTATDYINVGTDTSTPTHAGNFATYTGTWSAVSGTDAIFYIRTGGWDLSKNQATSVTLTGDRTLGNPLNQVDGASYILNVIQDGTGGHTLSFSSDYIFTEASTPILSIAPDAVDIFHFYSNGTELRPLSPFITVGTWTPELWDSSLSGSEGQTYNTQIGYYSKIGEIVMIGGTLVMTSRGTLTGASQAYIGGLPFLSASNGAGTVHFGFGDSLNLPAAGVYITGRIVNSVQSVRLYLWNATTGAAALTIGDLTDSSQFNFSGIYKAT